MIDFWLQWIGNSFILLATYALAKKKRLCLVLYSLGNVCWITSGIHSHLWAIVALDGILTALNIRAWIQWSKD
jgi:hypothetical protein